ncbi:MAG: hypothetical protein CFE46_19380 [Burkholderiales bacterium PBB6]|nr:MAG: hypothetical protein CFE46_19380 [Burkholderiales bacterium PBB6]
MGAPDLLEHLRLAGVALVATEDGRIKVTPASALTDVERDSIKAHKAELLALLVCEVGLDGPTDDVPVRLPESAAREARLIHWGWGPPEAEAIAERLTRSVQDGDDRVTCAADCAHYRQSRCVNFRQAGLSADAIARELAVLPQRCRGFAAATGEGAVQKSGQRLQETDPNP